MCEAIPPQRLHIALELRYTVHTVNRDEAAGALPFCGGLRHHREGGRMRVPMLRGGLAWPLLDEFRDH